MASQGEPDVSVSRTIAASPEAVWALISDVTRMGEWSPETTGARWVGGATGPAVGARFKGSNRNGARRWSTTCKVVAAEPGRSFAFDAQVGPLVLSRWGYELAPTDDGGCTATETWHDRRDPVSKLFSPLVSGVKDRVEHNGAGMAATLEALAAAAEAAP